MPTNIANFFESDRLSAVAGEDMTFGMIVKVQDNGAGSRRLMKLGDADSAQLVAGKYALVYKVDERAELVDSSTALARTGDRVEKILSGDAVVECRRGVVMEYSADMLHASLDPARAGTTPAAGDALEIKGSQWCKVGTSGAITTPVAGRVLKVHGTKVLVELV